MENSDDIFCRTCLKESKCVHPVTHTCIGHEDIDFALMLMSCTSISNNVICNVLFRIKKYLRLRIMKIVLVCCICRDHACGSKQPKILLCAIEPNDSLPHSICEDCISRLIMAYTFKQQCEKSDLFLRTRECLHSFKNNDKKIFNTFLDDDCINDTIQTEDPMEINIQDESTDSCNNDDDSNMETIQLNIKDVKVEEGPHARKLVVVCKNNKFDDTDIQELSHEVKVHNYKRKSKIFKCLDCHKQFASKYGLLYHTQLHTGIKKLTCPIENCKKKFFWKPALNRHMQIHSTEKQFLCNLCGKAYNAADSLQHHLKTHSGERPYLCVYCGKTYTQSVHLKYHMRMHSGERPHVCLKCNRSYTRPAHLKKHLNKYCGVGRNPPRRIRHVST